MTNTSLNLKSENNSMPDVECFLDDDKKTSVGQIELNSIPSLDMAFHIDKKYYKVIDIKSKGKSFEFIVKEIDSNG